jgi:predicted secreted protein
MSIISAIVLYAVTWFMVMFVVLPVGLRTQGDEGEIVRGTHAGAPANFRARRMMRTVTLIATPIWALIAAVIIFGDISVRDIDWFNRMGPPDGTGG